MSSTTTSPNAFLAIFWGGLACGVFDITQACVAWGIQNHLSPPRIFQSVASGLLGPKSFQGGAKTAALGLFLHFLIAFIWAVIYFVASRQVAFLTERPVIAGLLYGEFVWVMMNLRGGAALSHPSVAPQNRSGFDHYRADLAYSPRRIAHCAGGQALGADEIGNGAIWGIYSVDGLL